MSLLITRLELGGVVQIHIHILFGYYWFIFNPFRYVFFFCADFFGTLRPGFFWGTDYGSVVRFSKFGMEDPVWRTLEFSIENLCSGVSWGTESEFYVIIWELRMADPVWRIEMQKAARGFMRSRVMNLTIEFRSFKWRIQDGGPRHKVTWFGWTSVLRW